MSRPKVYGLRVGVNAVQFKQELRPSSIGKSDPRLPHSTRSGPAVMRRSFEKFLSLRSQVELESPSRAILFDQPPVDLSDSCRIHEWFAGLVFGT